MELRLKVLLFLIFINIPSYSCKVFLIGSRYVAPNSVINAILLKHDLNKDANVTIGYENISDVYNEHEDDQFELITIKTPKTIPTESNLTIFYDDQKKCKKQSIDLINTDRIPIIFIQFDKPIYKAGEKFKFRFFVLNRKMIPMEVNDDDIQAYTTDSKNQNTLVKVIKDKVPGVYEASITIPISSTSSIWKVNVQAFDRIVSKTFQVQEPSKTDTEVLIQMSDTIAFVDRKVVMILHAKNPSGQSVNVYLNARYENASIDSVNKFVKSMDLNATKTVLNFDIQDDLGLSFPTNDMILKFTAIVERAATRTKTIVEKEVKMMYKDKNTIQILRKPYFKPGFKYDIRARVKTLDGKPDVSFNYLKTKIEMKSKSGDVITSNYQTLLKNGDAWYSLKPKLDTTKIIITKNYAGKEHSEVVDVFPGPDQYMQVDVIGRKNPAVGSKIKIKVMASERLNELHMLIFGLDGVIFYESYPDSIGKNSYDIDLLIQQKMKPEARGLVFYKRTDGSLVYDEFSINLGFSIENYLDITVKSIAEPDENLKIDVKTEVGSLVYLIAVEANSELINRDNEISRESVYDEITYLLNRKYSLPSNLYQFEKTNAFVLQPQNDGIKCSDVSSSKNNLPMQSNQESPKVSIQRLFPKVLPEIKFIAENEISTVNLTIPNFTTTWRIIGISIHPTKGFTVAKTLPEVTVKGTSDNIILELSGITTLKEKEMHKFRITAYNSYGNSLSGNIKITVDNGNLYENVFQNKDNKQCINEQKVKTLTYNSNFTPQRSVSSNDFYISADNLDDITISATFIGGSVTAKTSKLIHVEQSKELKTVLISTKLIENIQNVRVDLPQNTSSDDTFVDIYGNLLGPALFGLDEVFGKSLYLDEEKVLKFSTDVIINKYFKFIYNEYHPKAIVARERIQENGPEVIKILKDMQQNLLQQAFITGVLIDAIEDYYGTDSIISNNLDALKRNQKYDGTFKYDPNFDNQKDISPAVRKDILIASIAITMSKTHSTRYKFKNEITRSINYLLNIKRVEYKVGDHLVSMIAYVLALNNRHHDAFNLLEHEINHGYTKIGKFEKNFSCYVQALSYIILTKILLRDDPKEQVDYLLKYRNPSGAFCSPYDTVLAQQALFEYTKYRNYPKNQFYVRIDSGNTYVETSEHFSYSPKDQNTFIETYHQHLGYINVYQKFYADLELRRRISDIRTTVWRQNQNSLKIEIYYSFKTRDVQLGNSIITLEVDLPVGYELRKDYNEKVGFSEDKRTIIYYFDKIEKNKNYIKNIIVDRNDNVDAYYKPLKIKFYDYYRPNIVDTYIYDVKCTK